MLIIPPFSARWLGMPQLKTALTKTFSGKQWAARRDEITIEKNGANTAAMENYNDVNKTPSGSRQIKYLNN